MKLSSILRNTAAIGLAAFLVGCTTPQKVSQTLSQAPHIDQFSTTNYLRLLIEERKGRKGIEFRLKQVERLEGDYAHFVMKRKIYPKAPYCLDVFDEKGKSMGSYSAYSSREVIVDDFSDKKPRGQIIVLLVGTIDCVIPYHQGAKRFVISEYWRKTELNVFPDEIKNK